MYAGWAFVLHDISHSEVIFLPSAKVLEEKKAVVAELTEKLQNACVGIVVDYKGIDVATDTAMRKELREAGVDYFVAKNTLLRRAAEGASLSELNASFEGTTSVALSTDDYTAVAKIISKYADDKETNFNIKNAFIDGAIASKEEIARLAKLPSREGMLAQLAGGLNNIIAGLAIALNAVKEKNEENGDAA